jgi:hypothetical protein
LGLIVGEKAKRGKERKKYGHKLASSHPETIIY